MPVKFAPNVVAVGEPGSGKTIAALRDFCDWEGAAIANDPHEGGLVERILEYSDGRNVLLDRVSDLKHTLAYGLLRPSASTDPQRRAQENQKRARLFAQVLMRRRGGDIAGSPLMEEHTLNALLLLLNQRTPKPVRWVPFAFLPATDEFRALVEGCTLPDLRARFQELEGMKPRSLRTEVASASRLINGVFLSPAFQARCESGFDLGAFLQKRGRLLVQRGDESEDVHRLVTAGITHLLVEHVETRPTPSPLIRAYFDECTNARTVGEFEQQKPGETRKYGLSWYFICQHPNFPDPRAVFANCQQKVVFRSTYEIARQMAPMFVAGTPAGEESRAARVDAVTADIVNFRPGECWLIDRDGARKAAVRMPESDWPDWPGFRRRLL